MKSEILILQNTCYVQLQMILVKFSPEISFLNGMDVGIYSDSAAITPELCWLQESQLQYAFENL